VLHAIKRALSRLPWTNPQPAGLRRPGETGAQADARALASDWRAVGDDLRAAMDGMDRHIADGRKKIRRL
jgi:hypothetical protein